MVNFLAIQLCENYYRCVFFSGYLYEFYTKKQDQLKRVAAVSGNQEYDFLATVLPDAISILQVSYIDIVLQINFVFDVTLCNSR